MSNQNQQAQPAASKKTAAQRIEALENAFMSLYHTADNMARDLLTAKEAIKLLGNKLDAVVKLAKLSDDDIAKLMIENNIDELKGKLKGLVDNGVLSAEEAVQENSFVVGRELDNEGVVVNPRLQFAMKAMPAKTQEKIKGAKPGDVITIEEGKLRFEVLESYKINPPPAAPEAGAVGKEAAEGVPGEVTEEKKEEAAPAPVGNA